VARAGERAWSVRILEGCLRVSGVGGMGAVDADCRMLSEGGGGRVDRGGGSELLWAFLLELKFGEGGGACRRSW
jgi:hypothetical protein